MAQETGQILSWGKCELKVEPITGSGAVIESATTFPIPVEDSTQLTPTQGDKKEATVEGGDVVASRTNAAKYTLTTRIRLHSSLKTPPLGDGDGQIAGEYKVTITPLENAVAPKVVLNRCSASAMFNYTSADGVDIQYDFDVLKPASGPKINVQ